MNLDNIKNKENEEFVRNFLNKYLSLGFGNLPKKEIDILVFSLLLEYGYLEGKDNYSIATELCTDDSKIRRLRLDVNSRKNIGKKSTEYHSYKDAVNVVLKDLFGEKKERLTFLNDNTAVTFSIDDPVLKRGFMYAVRKCGYSYNEYLNPDLVELPLYVFVAIVCEYDKKFAKEIQKIYIDTQKTINKGKKLTEGNFLKMAEKILGIAANVATIINLLSQLNF